MSEIASYFEWAYSKGVRWDNIAYPHSFEPGYSGTLATSHIHRGETLVTAPLSAIVNTEKALNSELSYIFESESDGILDPTSGLYHDLALATFLVYEKHKGEDSEWHLFIQNQPSDPEILQDWTDSELNELQDEDLVYDMRSRLAYDTETYNE